MSHEILVDTGAWLAISNRRDRHHTKAVECYRRLLHEHRTLVTTNLIIAEAYILIRRSVGHGPALQFLKSLRQSGRLVRIYSNATLETKAEDILRRYADQDFSLTDAVSFVVMNERGIKEAFAFDHHFLTAGFTLVPLL